MPLWHNVGRTQASFPTVSFILPVSLRFPIHYSEPDVKGRILSEIRVHYASMGIPVVISFSDGGEPSHTCL